MSYLLKPGLKTAFAEALYNEILSNTSSYYYFIGKPVDSTASVGNTVASENETRRDIVYYKKITATDVALTIPRVDWVSGTVYDMYDDRIGDRADVTVTPSVAVAQFGATGISNNRISISYTSGTFSTGDLVYYTATPSAVPGLTLNNPYYVKVITSSPPVIELHTSYTNAVGSTGPVAISVGSNTSNTLTRNAVTGTFDLNTFGQGWLVESTSGTLGTVVSATPSTIALSSGGTIPTSSTSVSITNVTASGARTIEDALFYVMNSEYNVYKCLDNNNGAPSTERPYLTSYTPFKTSDGYVWKFMYTIPTALVNKFITSDVIPVTTAVNDAYYSNGAINSVEMFKYGSLYNSSDTLSVLGDGTRADNVYRLITLSIDNPGSGYGAGATGIAIDPPYACKSWVGSTSVSAGEVLITSNNYIYKVIVGGTTDTVAPVHGSGTTTNGTASLKFVGIKATASITNAAGATGYSLSTPSFTNGVIGYINIVNVGSYYVTNPTISFSGAGSGAVATSTISSNGQLANITLSNRGSGYTSLSTVSVAVPTGATSVGATGITATAAIEIYNGYGYQNIPSATVPAPFTANLQYTGSTGVLVVNNNIFQYGNLFFKVVGATGYLGTPAPSKGATGFTGGSTGPTVSYTFIGETASVSVLAEKTKARLAPIVNNGQMTGVIVQDGGVGYTTATIVPNSATGSGAELVANLSYGDIDTNQATTELLAVPGSIEAINVLQPGYNYSGSTGVTITVTGDGSGATANATVTNGGITKINVLTAGSDYTYATVNIADAPGSGATGAIARVITSPANGHGRDAVKELFAKDLSITTVVATDLNQGVSVDNDYRQIGIIKNPTDYSTGLRYTEPSGSPCFVLGGDFTTVNIDDIITLQTYGYRYRVVGKTSTSVLVQSLDNAIPAKNDIMLPGNIAVTEVTYPTVDKYSGQLLYVDTESTAFKPTTEQTITVNTSITL